MREHGPSTDVYALGAILYELVTGRPPHRGETDLETLRLVTDQEPASPRSLRPGLPRDLATIALEVPGETPERSLRQCVGAGGRPRAVRRRQGPPARPVRPWQLAGKWARRRPMHAALVIVSTLAVSAVLGVLSWSAASLRRQDHKRQAAVAAEHDTQRAERGAQEVRIEE